MFVKLPNGETKTGLRILNTWETITHALGLYFPETISGKDAPGVYFSVKELKEASGFLCCKGRRPVVLFPEGTKTNGLGILNIDSGVIDLIEQAVNDNLKVHCIRFDHTFKYHNPYNSTDQLGLVSSLWTISQFSSKYFV